MDRLSSPMEPRGGREELRAALLRPALLHMREREGAARVLSLLSQSGIKESEVLHDTAWIPLSCARRVLQGVIHSLGEAAVASQGIFATSPEVLGPQVRLLRSVKTPKDAYEYFVNSSSEHTRVGGYRLTDLTETHATLIYSPFPEVEADQTDRCFCLLRMAELRALPRLWDLPEAELEELSCLSSGDLTCTYHIRWQRQAPAMAPWTAIAAASGSGGAVALAGSPLAAGLASLLGAGLGGGIGYVMTRMKREASLRALERHRIVALEHGLEQRGQLSTQAGDLTNSVLGGKYRICGASGRVASVPSTPPNIWG